MSEIAVIQADYRRRHPQPVELTDIALAFGIILASTLGVVLYHFETVLHWFLFPVFICGVIVTTDAVRWLRGRIDPFDPKGLIGVLGYFFFYLAPLLYVGLEMYTPILWKQIDWATWIGVWSMLNVVCLALYNVFAKYGFRHVQRKLWVKVWGPSAGPKMIFWTFFLLVVTALCQAIYLVKFGGISGIIREKEEATGVGQNLGIIVIIGTSLPAMLMIALTLLRGNKGWKRTAFWVIGFVLLAFLVGQFLIGGLAGSRAQTIISMIWAVGVVHFFWRPFKAWHFVLGLVPVVAFLYIMGFYKDVGSEAFGIFTGETTIAKLEEKTDRTLSRIFMGDIARSDLQAFALNVTLTEPQQFPLRLGKTYALVWTRFVPRFLWPSKPRHNAKVLASWEMSLGKGAEPGVRRGAAGSRVWGLGGEAIMNFGILGPPLMFSLFGYIVGRIRGTMSRCLKGDLRLFLIPQISVMLFSSIYADADNILNTFIEKMMIPLVLLVIISRRYKVPVQAVAIGPEAGLTGNLHQENEQQYPGYLPELAAEYRG